MEYKNKHDHIAKELRELDARFLLKLQDHKNLKKPSPNYASDLYNSIGINKQAAAIVPLWRRPRVWVIAASLLLVISSIYLIGSNDELTIDQIGQADVYAYIIDAEDIYIDDLLYSSVITEEITDTGLEILDQSILDYLDDHIDDIDITELNSY